MKVRLLDPIEGYEDVAEHRHPRLGEYYVGRDNKVELAGYEISAPWLVLTPKPLPVVEVPKFLGVVEVKDCERLGVVTRVDTNPAGVVCVLDCGSAWYRGVESIKLIRTANIPTSPELEALFKE